MEYDHTKAEYWLKKVQNTKEPLIILLTTHLLVEYGIDYLLDKHGRKPNEFKKDNRTWSFSPRLQMVRQMGLIEEYLYLNISKLNKIRNAFAHNLEVDIIQADLSFHDPQQRCDLKEFQEKGKLSNPPTEEEILTIFVWIGLLTFGEMNNLIIKSEHN